MLELNCPIDVEYDFAPFSADWSSHHKSLPKLKGVDLAGENQGKHGGVLDMAVRTQPPNRTAKAKKERT